VQRRQRLRVPICFGEGLRNSFGRDERPFVGSLGGLVEIVLGPPFGRGPGWAGSLAGGVILGRLAGSHECRPRCVRQETSLDRDFLDKIP
jgi:hypothetical protein